MSYSIQGSTDAVTSPSWQVLFAKLNRSFHQHFLNTYYNSAAQTRTCLIQPADHPPA